MSLLHPRRIVPRQIVAINMLSDQTWKSTTSTTYVNLVWLEFLGNVFGFMRDWFQVTEDRLRVRLIVEGYEATAGQTSYFRLRFDGRRNPDDPPDDYYMCEVSTTRTTWDIMDSGWQPVPTGITDAYSGIMFLQGRTTGGTARAALATCYVGVRL